MQNCIPHGLVHYKSVMCTHLFHTYQNVLTNLSLILFLYSCILAVCVHKFCVHIQLQVMHESVKGASWVKHKEYQKYGGSYTFHV